MATPGPLHKTFGRGWLTSEADTCSKCGTSIDDDACPTMIWNAEGDVVWVFCVKCESGIYTAIKTNQPRPN